MTGLRMSPECQLARTRPEYEAEHQHCPGNRDVRRLGAPAYEAPLIQIRCDCTTCNHPAPQ